MLNSARKILKTVFGYDSFISIQADIIQNVMARRDTLAIMPTGGGKSLCYQVPAMLFDGLTIVVSPLISLMNDQVQQLQENGVETALLNHILSPDEYRRNLSRIRNQQVKLLYAAPETLLKPGVMETLSEIKVACLAVDEAHCISEWGHDFRTEYRRLAEVRTRFPGAACLALTATATAKVRDDIKSCLGFSGSAEFLAGFDRPNLFLKVEPKDNTYHQVLSVIRQYENKAGIIYCATRRQVDKLAKTLCDAGISALPYHAGLPDLQRQEHQQRFSKDDIQVMVATIAFGMGIDKSNVRFVIHHDLPKNIESYYQEIGRAGRDGAEAHCMMLYSYGDIHKIKHFFNDANAQRQRMANLHLTAILGYVETDTCRRKTLLEYFGETYPHDNCRMCDNCLTPKAQTEDLTVPAQKFLSCVKRTGERFGVSHIIDVLRGSEAQKVIKFGHHRLSTYGIGREYSKLQWRHLARQLLHQGFMSQDMEFGAITLNAKTWPLFKGESGFSGAMPPEKTALPATDETRPETQPGHAHDPILFEILRQKRKALADEANVPPFVILSDKTLTELAIWFPQTLVDFLSIHGIGQVKAERYGEVFLHEIREYCHEKGIETRHLPLAETQPPKSKKVARSESDRKKRYQEIGEAYMAGASIKALAAESNIKERTVVGHLYTCFTNGFPLPENRLMEEAGLTHEKRTSVIELLKTLGTDRLRPVYEAMGKTVDYTALDILRLYYLLSGRK